MESKKPKGRPKGSYGPVRQTVKQVIGNLLSDYANSGLMGSDFAELDAKERLFIFEKLIQYSIPKMQSLALSGEEEKAITIEARLIELGKKKEG